MARSKNDMYVSSSSLCGGTSWPSDNERCLVEFARLAAPGAKSTVSVYVLFCVQVLCKNTCGRCGQRFNSGISEGKRAIGLAG